MTTLPPGLLRPAACRSPAPELAPALIGVELHCQGVAGIITETEAYQGEEDRACHASRGRTPRASGLYTAPGTLYIYRCYGIHWLLNIVCDLLDRPAAVLIRGLRLNQGVALARRRRGQPRQPLDQLTNGPGKVAQALGLDAAAHGSRLGQSDCPVVLRVPRALSVPCACGPRVGIDGAGEPWVSRPWRWWLAGFPVVRPVRTN